jgi:hypothetical protein
MYVFSISGIPLRIRRSAIAAICKTVTLALIAAALPLQAQDLEPRSYTNVPVGEHFIVVGAIRSEGGLSPTPSSPLQDAELTIDTGVVGYATTFSIAGSSAKFGIVGARMCYEGSAIFQDEFVEGRRCEYADPQFKVTWNFLGAPALALKDFASWTPGFVMGASLQVSAPWGDYSDEQVINAGANRWMFRPGLGASYRTESGRWHFDLMGSVRLFEDNDDGFSGIEVEQDPTYELQSHVIYNFKRGSWLSLNANFYRGGETEAGGITNDDYVENSRWGLTYSMPLNAHHSFKLYANTGAITRVGSDFDTFGAAWQYRF